MHCYGAVLYFEPHFQNKYLLGMSQGSPLQHGSQEGDGWLQLHIQSTAGGWR